VNRFRSIAGRFTLTDIEAQRAGLDTADDLNGERNFSTLLGRYKLDRERAANIHKRLDEIGRAPTETDAAVEALAYQHMSAGMQFDEAYRLAEREAQLAQGLQGQEGVGSTPDSQERQGDFDIDGQQAMAFVDEDGDPQVATVDDENSDERDPPTPEFDPSSELQYTLVPSRQRVMDLDKSIRAFFDAGGEVNRGVPDAKKAPTETPADRHFANYNAFSGRGFESGIPTEAGQWKAPKSIFSEQHEAAYQKMQAAKAAQSNGGSMQPGRTRADVLHAAFGDKGIRVYGAFDNSAVESFVTQAATDFRSTGRPVMVTAGETADQISQRISQHGLLSPAQRKTAVRKLKDAQAGNSPLYMSMGDFVLVSLPAQPKRGRKDNLRWYHQLGHELGHMVYDDYSHAAYRNKTQRDRLFAAFDAQFSTQDEAGNTSGPKAIDNPETFKEWFADQSANEMIERSFGLADPEKVTPFTRLANLMQGLWERIQHLVPRMTRTRSFASFAEAIRQGQIERRRGMMTTPDFTVQAYGGAGSTNPAARSAQLKAFAKKHTAPGSTVESAGRLVRTVVGRIESYSSELAKRLYTRSAADRSVRGVQSYERLAQANRDRWTGQMERSFSAVYQAAGAKTTKDKNAALRQAFRDFEAGRTHTRGAMELAKATRALAEDARKGGLLSTLLDTDRPPAAMDHHKIDADRQAFTALMRETFPEASAHELSERLNMLLDTQGQSEFAIAPGLPVSYHDTSRKLIDTVGVDRLREAGFIAEPSEAVFYHWIDGMAKRAAWEANFGGYTRQVGNTLDENRRLVGRDDPQGELVRQLGLVNEQGNYYDPNGEFHQLMDVAVREHGEAARKDILDMLDGVMGRTTSKMPRGIRNLNDWATAWVGWTVLLFSGIASIPEIGLPAVRAHGRAGMIDGVRGYAEARRFAKAAGNVLSHSAEQIMWQSMGDNYESPLLNKMGTAFFKYNGQKAITDVNRIMGISIGTQYLLRSAEMGDTQALQQLGLTAEDVRTWDKNGRQVWTAGGDSRANDNSAKVQAALTQFMYEGSSMPSKFQNPSWFNNPYLKMFWMIKRYMYAYGEGILMGMWRQSKRQWVRGQGLGAEQKAFMAAAPFMAFAVATIPLAAAGTELREWMRPITTGRPGKDIDDHGGVAKYSEYLFSRAGGYGPLEMIRSMRQQSDWGYSPLGSFSPVIGKLEMLANWGADGSLSGSEAGNKLRQLTPIASQLPGPVNKAVDKIFD
jgi:hypothetical protein